MKCPRVRAIGTQLTRLLSNRKNLGAASLAVADLFSRTIGLIITPYLANKMGTAGYGALNLYLATVEILAFLLVLGGPPLVTADYVRNGYVSARRTRADTLRYSLWTAIALLAVSLTVSWRIPSSVPLFIGVLIVAVSYVTALNSLELSYYRGAQIYRYAVAGQFAYSTLSLALTVLVFEFGSPTAANRLLSIALAGCTVQLAYLLELRRRRYDPATPRERRDNTLRIIRFGISLSVHVASHWIQTSIDRFVIAGFIGLSAAGVYSVAVTVASVPAIFFLIASQQLQPFLYRRLKENDFYGFNRVQLIFIVLVVAATTVYYVLSLSLFDIIFQKEYAEAKSLLSVLLIGFAFKSFYFVFTHACFYQQRGALISLVAAISLAVHLAGLGALALQSEFTLSGVATVFCMSSVAAAVGMAVLSRRTITLLRANPPEPPSEREN